MLPKTLFNTQMVWRASPSCLYGSAPGISWYSSSRLNLEVPYNPLRHRIVAAATADLQVDRCLNILQTFDNQLASSASHTSLAVRMLGPCYIFCAQNSRPAKWNYTSSFDLFSRKAALVLVEEKRVHNTQPNYSFLFLREVLHISWSNVSVQGFWMPLTLTSNFI